MKEMMSMKMHGMLVSTVLALAAVFAVSPATHAQSGTDLMRRAMEKQAERLAGVENVTITQEVMGMEMVMYMVKKEVDGGPILVPVTTHVAGMTHQIPQDEAAADWSNPFQSEWAERSRVVGQETVDGEVCTILAIEDFSDLEVPGLPGAETQEEEFQPKVMRFFVDDDDLVMRRVEIEADVTQEDGSTSPVEMAVLMSDYREVEGYLHPFKTQTNTQGMAEAMDMDKEEMQRQLAELKQQMANMPEAMQGMMATQIERLEAMIGEGGGMEVTITVKSLKVNAGPPGGG